MVGVWSFLKGLAIFFVFDMPSHILANDFLWLEMLYEYVGKQNNLF